MPSSVAVVTNAQTRVFNTWVMLSDQRPARVFYTVTITTQATLLAGQGGRVLLQIADTNTGTNLLTLSYGQASVVGGVVVPATESSIDLAGVVPIGKYMRMLPVNLTGAPSFSSWDQNANSGSGLATANSGFGTETLYD